MTNLILCGPPGSGKTTIGKIVAEKLQWKFIDLDDLIELDYLKEYGHPLKCRQIYAEKGSHFFRALERTVIESIQNINKTIIATGGGVIETKENIDTLRSIGTIAYLTMDIKDLFPSITRNGIPAYLDPKNPYESFEKLLDKRYDQYMKIADKIVPATGKSPEEVATILIELLNT